MYLAYDQGLEDDFDGANRKDVHRLILRQDQDTQMAEETLDQVAHTATSSTDDDLPKEKYFIRDSDGDVASNAFLPQKETQSMLELTRLPTCAVFHRLTSGDGIPHSFAGFIRQWPALPRLVVSTNWLYQV